MKFLKRGLCIFLSVLMISMLFTIISNYVGAVSADKSKFLFGDVSGDNVIDMTDLSRVIQIFNGTGDFSAEEKIIADVNGNGAVDRGDIEEISNYYIGKIEEFTVYSLLKDYGVCGNNVKYLLKNDGTLTVFGDGDMTEYSMNMDAPWYNYRSYIKSVILVEGVKNIGDYALYDCTSLASITIPDSVTSIGYYTFENCTSLTNIEVNEKNTYYSSLNGNLYNKDQSKFVQYAIGKTDTSFTIPDSVTSIGESAFAHCESLTSITIPDNVTSIGYGAFEDCISLTSITIPSSVTEIGSDAFGYYYDENDDEYYKIENFTIIGYSGTEAEVYAIANDFKFIILGEASTTESTSATTPTEISTAELKIDYIAAVGENKMDPAFLNGLSWNLTAESNRMSTEDDKVYTITYKGVSKGDGYSFKFAANGSWVDNWGAPKSDDAPAGTAEYNGNNINLEVTYDYADVTLTLDLTNFDYDTKSGATYKVDIVEGKAPETTAPETTEPKETTTTASGETQATTASGETQATSTESQETTATEETTATTATEETTVPDKPIVPGFYLVGSEEVCGAEWDWEKPWNYSTPMTASADGSYYYKVVNNVAKSDGNITDEGPDIYVFKVVYVDEKGAVTWHPDGMGNNTQVNVEEDGSTIAFTFVLLSSSPTKPNSNEAVVATVYKPGEQAPEVPTPPTAPTTTTATEETTVAPATTAPTTVKPEPKPTTSKPTQITQEGERKTQKISAKSYTKTYGNKAFSLKAKTSGNGKLTYKTSNKKVDYSQ